jgi:OOP family OmpA-OmpF porin
VNNRLVVILASLAFIALAWWSVTRHARVDLARSARNPVATAPGPAQPAAAPQPTLHVTQRDGRVILEGVLPSQNVRNAVLARARTLYGADRIEEHLRVAAGLADAGWTANAGEILPAFGKDAPKAGLIADGDTISLRGQVDSEDAKTRLVADANAAAGANVTVIDDLALLAPAPAGSPAAPSPGATPGGATPAAAGTAAPPAPPEPTGIAAEIARTLGGKCNQFESGSAELTADCERALDGVARELIASPNTRLIIEGYTDNMGPREVNRRISERRAKAVKSYLLSKGVDSHHAIAIGYGEDRPIADNSTADGRKQNRRIQFIVK